MVISFVSLQGLEWFFAGLVIMGVIRVAKLIIDVIPFA